MDPAPQTRRRLSKQYQPSPLPQPPPQYCSNNNSRAVLAEAVYIRNLETCLPSSLRVAFPFRPGLLVQFVPGVVASGYQGGHETRYVRMMRNIQTQCAKKALVKGRITYSRVGPAHMCLCKHMRRYENANGRTCKCVYDNARTHTHTHVCAHACIVPTYIATYTIYTYLHTFMRTHMHTYIHPHVLGYLHTALYMHQHIYVQIIHAL